jgi:aromatic-L-amino-acid decarboxylase
MAVVCFRHSSPGMSAAEVDEHNERLVERVNAGGAAYLTHTRLRGRTSMRVGIGNIQTTDAHLEQVWGAINALAEQQNDTTA